MSDHYQYTPLNVAKGINERGLKTISWLMVSLLISCLTSARAHDACAQGIASVNGEPVNYQRYQSHYQLLLKTHPQAAGNVKLERLLFRRALIPLVVEHLLRQEAKRVQLNLETIVHQDPTVGLQEKYKSAERLQAYLQRVGETEETLRLKSWNAAVTRALMRSRGLLNAAEDELRAEYERLSSRFRQPERVRARQILIEIVDTSKPEEIKAAKDRAHMVHKRLTRGNMTFEFAVRRHSDGPLKFKQGDLGFVERGQLVQPVEDAIWALKRGEISAPVRSQYGWHIIRRGQRLAPIHKTFASVRESLKEKFEGHLFHKRRRSFVKELWRSAKIETEVPLSY